MKMKKLGSTLKDKITGFSGIATGRASYITGCDQYLIQPPVKDGNFVDGKWIDEGRLEVIEESTISAESVQADDNGCDSPAPIK